MCIQDGGGHTEGSPLDLGVTPGGQKGHLWPEVHVILCPGSDLELLGPKE